VSYAETVIVGAGPYGLSLAAHLAAGNVRHRIFGRPMQFWSQIAAAGGERYLKSFCFGTDIATPERGFSFVDYSRPRGLETFEPCTIKDFAEYGLWFQQKSVDWVEPVDVVKVAPHGKGFAVTLENGEIVIASRVVIATGLAGFANIPAEVAPLAPDLVQHTSAIKRFADFRGRDVAVIGAGQSALEAAALLSEAGARPQLIVREPSVSWMSRLLPSRTLWQRIRSPISELGTGPKSWILTKLPGWMHFVPTILRTRFVKAHLPPEGAWWLRARVEHRIPLHCGAKLTEACRVGDRVALRLRDTKNLTERDLVVDDVIVGTGYDVDVDRLSFLDRQITSAVERIECAPKLSSTFESSVAGLYFIGPSSAMSFGPLFRFVAGTAHTSKTLSRRLQSLRTRK
jgi:cation diffusion facilitator CzcD-associated flavoprotein CzcO